MGHNNKYTRLRDVGFDDGFVIGVEGGYEQAKLILEKVTKYVETELSLDLNPDKTGIIHYTIEPVKFLGYTIAAPHLKGSVKPLEHIKTKERTIIIRKNIITIFHLDLVKALAKLTANRVIRKRTSLKNHNKLEYRGRFKGNLINLEHADLIRYYNSVIQGIYNYFDGSAVNNRNDLIYVIWLLTESCAMTLALKFKLKTLKKTFGKFGKNLTCYVNNGKNTKIISVIGPRDLKMVPGAAWRLEPGPGATHFV